MLFLMNLNAFVVAVMVEIELVFPRSLMMHMSWTCDLVTVLRTPGMILTLKPCMLGSTLKSQ